MLSSLSLYASNGTDIRRIFLVGGQTAGFPSQTSQIADFSANLEAMGEAPG
jgi:hypothetical protein